MSKVSITSFIVLIFFALDSSAKEGVWIECLDSPRSESTARFYVDISKQIVKQFNSPYSYKIRSIEKDYLIFGTKVPMANGKTGDVEITIGRKDFSYHSRFKNDEDIKEDYSSSDFVKNSLIKQGECKKITKPEALF